MLGAASLRGLAMRSAAEPVFSDMPRLGGKTKTAQDFSRAVSIV
jgi:hypothetical protein